jgi:hypothetical protein
VNPDDEREILMRAGYTSGHRALLAAAALLLVAGGARHAGAEPADVAVAESLFREGKERMAAKDYPRACPKLADSFRLDPATGTLLALAMCHERAGKLATAWAEYADAASRSKREARADREKAAREKVTALEPRLSSLTISVARGVTEMAGLEITRNGVPVGSGTLGTAVPVDGGTYTIGASAPGKKTWSAQVTIGQSGERHTMNVPGLEDAPPAAATAPVAAKSPAPPAKPAVVPPVTTSEARSAPPEADKGGSGYGALAAATIVGGVVSVGIGTVYMLRAMAKNEDSKNGCDGDKCSSAGTQDRLDARAYGNVATVGFLAGGVLLAMGTTLYIVGSPKPAPAHAPGPAPTSASLQATPLVGPGAFGGVLQGTF